MEVIELITYHMRSTDQKLLKFNLLFQAVSFIYGKASTEHLPDATQSHAKERDLGWGRQGEKAFST